MIRRRSGAGFTLLEIVLAIVIATGVLVVALSFYQQSASLRTQLLREAERVSAIRLLMDRITAELRAASGSASLANSFVGEPNSIQFVKAEFSARSDWNGGPLGRSLSPATDLKLIRYGVNSSDGTNVTGLVRAEEPWVQARTLQVLENLNASMDDDENGATNRSAPLLTDELHYLRFRYWNGSAWQDSWNSADLPAGVEVSLGVEPMPPGEESTEYPDELFRRIIYLPGSGAGRGDSLSFTNTPAGDALTGAAP